MSEAVARTKENLGKCRCMDCPSYTLGCKIRNMPGNIYKLMEDLNDVEHFEGMYCAFEKSRCIEEDRGCLCEECQVHSEYHLKREDYCLKDGGLSEKDAQAAYQEYQEKTEEKSKH